MRPTRVVIVLLLVSAGLCGAFWGARAQEGRALWAPPPALPPDAIRQTGGTGPPSLPEIPSAQPTPLVPPPAFPAAPPKTSDGWDVSRTGKMEDSGSRTAKPIPEQLPLLESAGPTTVPPPLPGLDKTLPMSRPDAALPTARESKQPAQPMGDGPTPFVVPQPRGDTSKSLLIDPMIQDGPKSDALPKANAHPPTIVVPSPAAVASASAPRTKAFMRLRSGPALSNEGPSWPASSSPGPNAALAQLQTPGLMVEKRAATISRPGEPVQYHITVRNLGAVPAQQVRVEDELPSGAKLLSADPAPQTQGQKVIWSLPELAPQREVVLRLTIQTGAATIWTNQMSVHVSATTSAPALPYGSDVRKSDIMQAVNIAPQANPDDLVARLVAPSPIWVGKRAVFDVRVTNTSKQPLHGLVLFGFLPEGLMTPEGRSIQGQVDGTLQPGETKTLKMPTDAVRPGSYTVEIKVTTANGHEILAKTMIDIGADDLLIQAGRSTRLYLGREVDHITEITNTTNRSMRNVMIAAQLPEGLEFVSANERGLYQANSRVVHWLIDTLPAGRKLTLITRLYGLKTGQHEVPIKAKADGLADKSAAGAATVEGATELTLKVIDGDNPLVLGRKTVYEIQVVNPGSKPATNVQLQIEFPAGLKPNSAQGTTRHAVERQLVTFEPIPLLAPQGQAVYHVSAIAQAAGDQRVRFAVTNTETGTPVTREINTLVSRE